MNDQQVIFSMVGVGRVVPPDRQILRDISLGFFYGAKTVREEISGGERNRVHLAKTLTQGANVILLDEPTNDLDVNTLRALEDALDNFAGSALIVSHDRWFLDRVCTHILAFEGESQVRWFVGNWSDYEIDRKRRLGVEAEAPGGSSIAA